MNKKWLIILIVVITHLSTLFIYPFIPDHSIDEYNAHVASRKVISKILSVYLIPLILTFSILLFYYLPKIDPLKKNIEKFQTHYEYFILMYAFFMLYMYIIMVLRSIGVLFDIDMYIMPAVSILLIYTGFFLQKAKRNWFIGLRTPWTLTDDKVWEKTHEFGGKFFVGSGLISIIGLFFKEYMVFFILVPVIVSTVIIFFYSYVIWSKINKKN
jgi:uncharacterized membrane protein